MPEYRIRGTIEEVPGSGAFILVILMIIGGILNFINFLGSYREWKFPAREVATFYYFVLIWPIKTLYLSLVWTWSTFGSHGVTPFPNLNTILGIVAVLIALALLLGALSLIVYYVASILGIRGALLAVLAPLVFLVIWKTVAWLFASGPSPS